MAMKQIRLELLRDHGDRDHGDDVSSKKYDDTSRTLRTVLLADLPD